jgi:hypothetical protein
MNRIEIFISFLKGEKVAPVATEFGGVVGKLKLPAGSFNLPTNTG